MNTDYLIIVVAILGVVIGVAAGWFSQAIKSLIKKTTSSSKRLSQISAFPSYDPEQDQCRHCSARGSPLDCLDSDCRYHHLWLVRELVQHLKPKANS